MDNFTAPVHWEGLGFPSPSDIKLLPQPEQYITITTVWKKLKDEKRVKKQSKYQESQKNSNICLVSSVLFSFCPFSIKVRSPSVTIKRCLSCQNGIRMADCQGSAIASQLEILIAFRQHAAKSRSVFFCLHNLLERNF
ncbi:hypothetical protein Y1Q_0003726 [Alligator mississippiensis]|uniref:Uncharacterized protein n=1 Tax=Alligator mississippiensis TaxID=8496 RepID=A0A151MN15_ALLMI|nr:hypothetical protein Y1Q_0003726 [Alligator mississippiensis]